jgi:O-antigen/teichoic acid export membrane protein
MGERSGRSSRLRQRLMRGLGATALGPVVTALIQLGSVPILLHVWGVAKYGDWLLLSAIPSYLTLSDLGLGDASGSDMSMRVAAGDRKAALETFQSSWVFVTAVSSVILLLALIFVWWIPWQPWLKLSSVSSRQAAELISVLGAYVVLSQQNGIAESGYRSDGHFATGTFWMAILRFVEAAVAAIVAVLHGDLLAVASTYLLVRCVGTVGYALLLRRVSPWIHYGIGHARLKTIRQVAAPAFAFMAFPAGQALSFQGFTILIGAVLGPIAVVSFSTLRTLSRLNVQILTMIANTLWPELSRAFGEGDVHLARRLHRLAWQASLGLSLLGGALLWMSGPFIYRVWVHHNVSFNTTCFHVLLLVAVASSLWTMSSVILMSINVHSRIAAAYVAATAISLGLASLFIPVLGTTGAAIALLLTEGWMTWIVLHSALQHSQDSLKTFFSAIVAVRCLPLQRARAIRVL